MDYFRGSKNALRSIERLDEANTLPSLTPQRIWFGYAGKRNAILFSAIESRMDYCCF
jgi:hypothetical protein